MSKLNLRKITVDPTKCNIDTRRPSVFERLGTKPAVTNTVITQNTSDYCRNWALNGSCSYGKACKYANTHTLISPSKRVKKDNAPTNAQLLVEDPFKRLTSKIVKKASHSPDLNLEEWNQTDLEYEDEKVLERRRQLLQRELEIQMKKDKEVHGKDKNKPKKKAMSSSSSSHTSSSTSSSSTSSSDDSSSSSTSDSRKKVKKFKKGKHHGTGSPDYEDDKERKKKGKLKRLGSKNEKSLPPKKKHKVDIFTKKDTSINTAVAKPVKKTTTTPPIRKHTLPVRAKSPLPPISSHSSSANKPKERPQSSESPKVVKNNEVDKDRHHQPKPTMRESEKMQKDLQKKIVEKKAEFEKSNKCRTEEKSKNDDRSKQRSRERDRRSRTPPVSDRSKHQYSVKDQRNKSKRSPTPEKSRLKHDLPSSSRHQEKAPTSSSRSSREVDKKDRDAHDKRDRSKDRKDSKQGSSQNDSHRKNSSRDLDDKNYSSDRSRQRSRERRDKDHNSRDGRSHSTHSSRVGRSDLQPRDLLRDKDRDDGSDRRERQRDRDRDRDSTKTRDRDLSSSMLVSSSSVNSLDKNMRYSRDKDRSKECSGLVSKSSSRDRRNDRDKERSDVAKVSSDRDRGSQRFDTRYDSRPSIVDKEISIHKTVDRDRSERFPRDRPLLDRVIDKTPSRDHHLIDRDPLYDRDRHRRYNARLDRGHQTTLSHSDNRKSDQSHLPPLKIDRLSERRDSPRRGVDDRNFDRGYQRLGHPDHWEEQEESSGHIDYHRDHHTHDDDRNRKPVESRRYNSPFNERRGRGGTDDRTQSRYQQDRQFDDHHHSILYSGDKLRSGGIRDEGSNDNWEVHHDLEHGSRDRAYPPPPPNEWEEREWRGRPLWERESLPRSDAHEEEWPGRYDSPMSNADWKVGEPRKWDNQSGLHVRNVYGRNDRLKELEITDSAHCKRRPYNTPEHREDLPVHGPKPNSLHGAMKEEPINKKLMELAEGKPRRSRERSADSFQKKSLQKEKSERDAPKEPPPVPEPKRPCLEEPLLPTLHTESDLSDISDDPDDILDMEEEVIEASNSLPKKPECNDRESLSAKSQEASLTSPKSQPVDSASGKEKDNAEIGSYSNKNNNIEEENMETMDFEEISDGELEEDIKTSCKGLGDALGVDWESLVKESQPRRAVVSTGQESIQDRWKCKAVFQRIGISVRAAGEDFVDNLLKKYSEDDSKKLLLDNVALVHTALVRKQLVHSTTYDLFASEESNISRNQDISDEDADDEEDVANFEKYKPYTDLYQEAKLLLQQT